ncbi:MAG: 4'-phosphopantetheinyl transferase superfamily protein [Alphaproteobacteria bacterium]|nr:4'-phosphopantetheinyl transferase superfamily protein [Alphaproteobacteria bacterium]MBV9371715.1 4'-phosphopantetheinyl transferase superfamily protein [Alphaproteobacteria bacterium]MBV9902491.1 4'-phosphopantetheinyl transferase superfamily protein [Alphaproteobacteria bacterium]
MSGSLPVPEESGREAVVLYALTGAAGGLVEAALARLPESERAQAARFRWPEDRRDFALAHLLLRHCLERSTGRRKVSLAVGEFGKPDLEPAHGDPPLRFNISHARGCVACALVRGGEIGVDVEDAAQAGPRHEVAESVFSDEERRLLAGLDEARRREAFVAMWTMKEAVIKADGRGLGMKLQGFSVDPDRCRLRFEGEGEASGWRLARHDVETFRLAVALKGARLPEHVLWERVELAGLLDRRGRR